MTGRSGFTAPASCSSAPATTATTIPTRPSSPGIERFRGEVVHPQFWPEDLDYTGKRVVVIGSGATAISLIPALTEKAAHVTMLQRSPTYMMSMARVDPMVDFIRRVLPRKLSHSVVRVRNAAFHILTYFMFRKAPKFGRKLIRNRTKAALPVGYDVDLHFRPKYDPWDQRMCLILDHDLFERIKQGRAEVVTDTIDHVDETGIVLASGARLDADVIVTATGGLQLQALGGIRLFIDDTEVDPTDRFVYKEYLLEDVPNMAWCIGYTNASWTLRADMTAKAVAKLLAYMDARGYTHATRIVATGRSPRSRRSICRPVTSSGRRTRCRSQGRTGRGTCGTITCSTSSITGSTGSRSRWCSAAPRSANPPAPPPDLRRNCIPAAKVREKACWNAIPARGFTGGRR